MPLVECTSQNLCNVFVTVWQTDNHFNTVYKASEIDVTLWIIPQQISIVLNKRQNQTTYGTQIYM